MAAVLPQPRASAWAPAEVEAQRLPSPFWRQAWLLLFSSLPASALLPSFWQEVPSPRRELRDPRPPRQVDPGSYRTSWLPNRAPKFRRSRSEEHTSELQSPVHLV